MTEKFTFIYILNNQNPKENLLLIPEVFYLNIEDELNSSLPEIEAPKELTEELLMYLYSE
jgi:hypothetical protein